MKALEVRNLHKTYKSGVEALKGVNLDVDPGDFFALLGPNGAGKSTTIGSWMRARAIIRRRFMPPDNSRAMTCLLSHK